MPLFVHEYEVQKPRWGDRWRGGKTRGGGGAKEVRARGARGARGCERRSECLGTHENRYHLSNEALALNGLGGHREMQVKGI